jgi:hypothetical protein
MYATSHRRSVCALLIVSALIVNALFVASAKALFFSGSALVASERSAILDFAFYLSYIQWLWLFVFSLL